MRMILSALAVAAVLASAAPVEAQSFNCRLARTPDEVAICQDERLSVLDERMSSQYFRLRNTLGFADRRELEAEQSAWLRSRRSCGRDFACIEVSYRQRMRELAAW